MATVSTCSYRTGSTLTKWKSAHAHPFPVIVAAHGGEDLRESGNARKQYDTLISINVLEHVQDAFQYLANLFTTLRSGGLLIFHDRYYDDASITNGDLFHPVRIKKVVLDHFLSGFEILYNNCHADYDGRPGERGYYVLAIKR